MACEQGRLLGRKDGCANPRGQLAPSGTNEKIAVTDGKMGPVREFAAID